MNLHRMLEKRAREGRPVRVGLIGAGKFGSMFLSQAHHMAGVHVAAVADVSVDRTRRSFSEIGWPAERLSATSVADALKTGATHITEDALALIAADGIEVVIEATGNPVVGIAHCLACCEYGRHVVMVNVEADALAGPLLARRAEAAGVIYSLAYGDQPALICELVDWARACGLPVVAAGKGTKYLPDYLTSTPKTVWDFYGIERWRARAAGMNPQMFNSFLDGTKSAIEMAAVANATGLTAASEGLQFPPCGVDDLPKLLRPRAAGGVLDHAGQVEVISSLRPDGRPVERDLRWGVYVVFEAPDDYTARCFGEYGLVTDPDSRVSALYRPYHLIGLELGVSVASVALRGEPTGVPTGFRADVVAVAKRDLAAGEILDGEGGYTVRGRLMPASDSLAAGALPIGLAHGVKLARHVKAGAMLHRGDVALDNTDPAVRTRRDLEAAFATEGTPVAAQ